jgi:hypothetical protein
MVAAAEADYSRPCIHHYACYLVSQDDTGLYAAAEDPGHHQQIVMAKSAGCHLDQHLMGTRDRRG